MRTSPSIAAICLLLGFGAACGGGLDQTPDNDASHGSPSDDAGVAYEGQLTDTSGNVDVPDNSGGAVVDVPSAADAVPIVDSASAPDVAEPGAPLDGVQPPEDVQLQASDAADGGITPADVWKAVDGGSAPTDAWETTDGGLDPDDVWVPDDASVVSMTFPAAMECGASMDVSVTMKNTSQATWTHAKKYKLGATDGSDPFYDKPRVKLPKDVSVGPGATHTFELTIVAPAAEGQYVTEWRMIREGINWFGELAVKTIDVTCPSGPPDPAEIKVVHPTTANAPQWAVDHTISVIAFRKNRQEWTPAAPWKGVDLFNNGKELAGNLWIVRDVNGSWEATPVEWFFEGMTRQFLTKEMIKENLNIANNGPEIWPSWPGPAIGETLYFFLSTPAWHGTANKSPKNARTNIVEVTWGQ